jgi:gamma-glutamylcyclotransferase (GGCT)/AIG2-like uncharacterized protein YtfP
MTTTAAILLFSYGTLQDKKVQVAHFGRELRGRPANPADEVAGSVFEITAEELAAADQYEVPDYERVAVELKSGAQAWVYVRA